MADTSSVVFISSFSLATLSTLSRHNEARSSSFHSPKNYVCAVSCSSNHSIPVPQHCTPFLQGNPAISHSPLQRAANHQAPVKMLEAVLPCLGGVKAKPGTLRARLCCCTRPEQQPRPITSVDVGQCSQMLHTASPDTSAYNSIYVTRASILSYHVSVLARDEVAIVLA